MAFQEVKICLLGDSGVGKSSIVQRFVHNTFNAGNESTIGASFMTKSFVLNNITYKFNIWDTAGQERYRALAPMYYRGSAACVIVYDVTSQLSYRSVLGWVRELQIHADSNVILALAGNKSDLNDRREVPMKEAKAYAESINAIYVETSAKSSQNITELFFKIANKIPKEQTTRTSPSHPNLTLTPIQNASDKRRCCRS